MVIGEDGVSDRLDRQRALVALAEQNADGLCSEFQIFLKKYRARLGNKLMGDGINDAWNLSMQEQTTQTINKREISCLINAGVKESASTLSFPQEFINLLILTSKLEELRHRLKTVDVSVLKPVAKKLREDAITALESTLKTVYATHLCNLTVFLRPGAVLANLNRIASESKALAEHDEVLAMVLPEISDATVSGDANLYLSQGIWDHKEGVMKGIMQSLLESFSFLRVKIEGNLEQKSNPSRLLYAGVSESLLALSAPATEPARQTADPDEPEPAQVGVYKTVHVLSKLMFTCLLGAATGEVVYHKAMKSIAISAMSVSDRRRQAKGNDEKCDAVKLAEEMKQLDIKAVAGTFIIEGLPDVTTPNQKAMQYVLLLTSTQTCFASAKYYVASICCTQQSCPTVFLGCCLLY